MFTFTSHPSRNEIPIPDMYARAHIHMEEMSSELEKSPQLSLRTDACDFARDPRYPKPYRRGPSFSFLCRFCLAFFVISPFSLFCSTFLCSFPRPSESDNQSIHQLEKSIYTFNVLLRGMHGSVLQDHWRVETQQAHSGHTNSDGLIVAYRASY